MARLSGALAALAVAGPAAADGDAVAPGTTVAITGYYYAMRDQPDFGVGVAAIDRGPLHLEARYNYEARDAASAFVGWKLAGGDEVTFEFTPILGGLFGAAHGVIPGLEASLAWGPLDVYVEAEYVRDLDQRDASYTYAWGELGFTPFPWLRAGLAGQRTRVVNNGRDLQRGAFVQVMLEKLTIAVYAFNPDSAARYIIVSLGARF